MLLRVNYPAPWRDCLLTLDCGEIMILIGQNHPSSLNHLIPCTSGSSTQPVLISSLPSSTQWFNLPLNWSNTEHRDRHQKPVKMSRLGSPDPGASSDNHRLLDMDGEAQRGRPAEGAAADLMRRLGVSPERRIKVTPEDDARVLGRIDMVVLPLMLAVYFLQGEPWHYEWDFGGNGD